MMANSFELAISELEVDWLIGMANYLGPISSFHNNRKSVFVDADFADLKKKVFLFFIFITLLYLIFI
jgi:hypothetical protein